MNPADKYARKRAGKVMDVINEIPDIGQAQFDLKMQIALLAEAGNKLGLYDAVDFLQRSLYPSER